MYDVTSYDSFEALQPLLDAYLSAHPGADRCSRVCLVANEARVGMQHTVSAGYALEWCQANGDIPYFEVDPEAPQVPSPAHPSPSHHLTLTSPLPFTPNSQPSTLNPHPHPSPLTHQPSTLNPQRSPLTLNPHQTPLTDHRSPLTLLTLTLHPSPPPRPPPHTRRWDTRGPLAPAAMKPLHAGPHLAPRLASHVAWRVSRRRPRHVPTRGSSDTLPSTASHSRVTSMPSSHCPTRRTTGG